MNKKTKLFVCCSLLTVTVGLASIHYYINTHPKPPSNGWYQTEEHTQYYQEGNSLKGFVKINDVLSYFDENGNMICHDFFNVNGHTYYADAKGCVANGLCNIDNQVYYFDQNSRGYTGKLPISKTETLEFQDGKLITNLDTESFVYYGLEDNFYLKQKNTKTNEEKDIIIPDKYKPISLPYFDDLSISKIDKIEILGDEYAK